jgi:putative chitobiose transport system permease protein
MVMTNGGPIGSTYTLVQHLYSKGWINQFMGEASAVGVFLFLITLIFTLFQLRAFRAL